MAAEKAPAPRHRDSLAGEAHEAHTLADRSEASHAEESPRGPRGEQLRPLAIKHAPSTPTQRISQSTRGLDEMGVGCLDHREMHVLLQHTGTDHRSRPISAAGTAG